MATETQADKYEVMEKIGQGSFGIIRKVRRKADNHVLCRKEINYLKMSTKEREQLQAELAVLKGLRHPNIVAYYEREHIKSSMDLHIYMEYCEDGDLGKRIKYLAKNNLMAEEDFVWSVFAQLVTALYRCHYGEDPPEVGKNALGLGGDVKPVRNKGSHTMILHRDLKPENIFLSTDSSVKLGDFGLSKIMASHDFASTYVGTPFYMSPEICAAEQYSLYSDIWAFGCIMYELCSREPPFNAKTHLELIQKIRLGRVRPLSSIYSRDLQETIASCLRVNPQSRPDTAQLLNLPMVKLKRKEMEVVTLGKQLRTREDQAIRKLKELEQQLSLQDSYKERVRNDLEASLRREWEVKARLEIDRQVQAEVQKLLKDFESEVSRRVQEEVSRTQISELPPRSSTPNLDDVPDEVPFLADYRQSQVMFGDSDANDTPDLSELSMDSPTVQRLQPSRKPSSRTPFARAHTMFEAKDSPMDIQMADPSPAPIASLGLSPWRASSKASNLGRNLFSNIAKSNRSTPSSNGDFEQENPDDGEDNDDIATLPSPTKTKAFSNDPFKVLGSRPARPSLHRANTSVPQNIGAKPTLFGKKAATKSRENLRSTKSRDNLRGLLSPGASRLTKKASSSALGDIGSPTRKAPAPPSPTRGSRPSSRTKVEDVRQSAMRNNAIQGRTLVELAQARTLSDVDLVSHDDADDFLRLAKAKSDGSGVRDAPRGLSRLENEKSKSASAFAAAPIWDPERDEMPSPFLVRSRPVLAGQAGGPGMRHLR